MTRTFLLLSLTICASLIFPAQSQAGLLDFFFPSLKKEQYNPYETMRAPFAQQEGQDSAAFEIQNLPENAIPLNRPHRSKTHIREWLVRAVSDAMTFENSSFEEALSKTAASFDKNGQAEYIKFLNEKNIERIIRSGKYNIRSFIKDTPILESEGEVNGTYHWLFSVPVMLSYMDKNMKSYENAEPVNQTINLIVQVGRIETTAEKGGIGIVIERWEGRAEKISRK